ncbi:MAG: 4-(cytidine 5'-diphospho)-2-C-methyl-D-erythritol kinase [Actinobacteria bacterium]|nr:4-(cytidine 5'-diphospho)-2-C-methyl-D-erythritol kinase [Actinomycetota bacterium]
MATVRAQAKLTLSLRITGVRSDGYHLIDAEMVTLDLADILTITPGSVGLTCDGPFAEGVPMDGSNLVARALDFVGRTAAVHIRKEIPHGGGLGGGSSDAAAILRWAGYRDTVGAAVLGADVPFCLAGGRARVRGIGDVVEPMPLLPKLITLVIPPLTVSTPAVYRAWDELGGPSSNSLNDGSLNDPLLNDLESAALVVEPRLTEWRDRITKAAGRRPTLAGSGATWFLEGHHRIAAELPEALVILTEAAPITD